MPVQERRRSLGIGARMVALVSAAAAIVVLVSAVAAYPLVRAAALSQAQEVLANLADLTVAALDHAPTSLAVSDDLLPQALAEILKKEQVVGYLVHAGAAPPPSVSVAELQGLRDGKHLSTIVTEPGDDALLVEGRRLSNGIVLILEQPATVIGDVLVLFIARFAMAMAIGLAIAIPIGIVVARRMSRPLHAAQQAAGAMARGERDVRLSPAGPSEIADIAIALNQLSEALQASEGRQREFLMSISHELRTPLTAVRGYGEALADGVVSGDDIARSGAAIESEAVRLDRLVSDLLELARLGAVDFRIDATALDLDALAAQAAQVWADRCSREGVRFELVVRHSPVPAYADPMRVRQVIDNLAENALRVVPEGGVIVLDVRAEPATAVLQVRDSGPGLAPEDIATAFEPGVLNDKYRGLRPVGTGLGLALVASLAARMGGGTVAGRAPEGGAAFTVYLPRLRPAQPSS